MRLGHPLHSVFATEGTLVMCARSESLTSYCTRAGQRKQYVTSTDCNAPQ